MALCAEVKRHSIRRLSCLTGRKFALSRVVSIRGNADIELLPRSVTAVSLSDEVLQRQVNEGSRRDAFAGPARGMEADSFQLVQEFPRKTDVKKTRCR